MSVADVDLLLQGIPGDAPCGTNLEYDPAFAEMERLSQGKPERQMGDTVIPAEEPNWREVRGKAIELFSRTKDLRVGVLLARALTRTDGIPGLAAGLATILGLVERHWDGVHPRLDPEDNNDPTMRVNILASLCSVETMLRDVREAPLVASERLGRYSYRDVLVASGQLQPSRGENRPEMGAIDAAFGGCEIEPLKATTEAASEAIDRVVAIESTLTERVGASRAADFADLLNLVKSVRQVLAEKLAARGIAIAGIEGTAGVGAVAAAATPGTIGSREDVIRQLDLICDWYARHEPSSPVPMLLKRAKRLVHKDFMQIVRELASDAVSQVERIRGPEEG